LHKRKNTEECEITEHNQSTVVLAKNARDTQKNRKFSNIYPGNGSGQFFDARALRRVRKVGKWLTMVSDVESFRNEGDCQTLPAITRHIKYTSTMCLK